MCMTAAYEDDHCQISRHLNIRGDHANLIGFCPMQGAVAVHNSLDLRCWSRMRSDAGSNISEGQGRDERDGRVGTNI